MESSETKGKTYNNLLLFDDIVQLLERVKINRQFLFVIMFKFIVWDNSLFNSKLFKALGGGNLSNFCTLNDSGDLVEAPEKDLKMLNPNWVTGFVDAEGSFSMSIFKSKTAAIGWTIEPCFIITLHNKDIELLNKIQLFFGVGVVSTIGSKGARYRVRSRDGLKTIISHFNKYPLQTTKIHNFVSFCKILDLMNQKYHTNVEGFLNLVSLINKLNNPLSPSLLNNLSSLGELPNVDFELTSKESISLNGKLGGSALPWWISGFTTGDPGGGRLRSGSFTYFTRNRKKASGEMVKDYTLAYEVSQRSDSIHVLDLIAKTFECGKVYSETRGVSKYRLVTKDQILSKLVPFFEKYPLEGNKNLQYKLWIQIVDILQTTGRSEQRNVNVERLIKELSQLNK